MQSLALKCTAGIAEAYWEYRLKPWDVCAGVLILEEAGGKVTTMDGLPYRCGMRCMEGCGTCALHVQYEANAGSVHCPVPSLCRPPLRSVFIIPLHGVQQ